MSNGIPLSMDEEIRLREIEAKNTRSSVEKYGSRKSFDAEKLRQGKSFKNVSDRISSTAYAGQVSLGWWNTLKPLLIGALILFFLIGPGLAAFQHIFGALNIWVWVGIIFVIILWWRNR